MSAFATLTREKSCEMRNAGGWTVNEGWMLDGRYSMGGMGGGKKSPFRGQVDAELEGGWGKMGPIGLSLASIDDVGIRNDGTRGEAGRGYPGTQFNGKVTPRTPAMGTSRRIRQAKTADAGLLMPGLCLGRWAAGNANHSTVIARSPNMIGRRVAPSTLGENLLLLCSKVSSPPDNSNSRLPC